MLKYYVGGITHVRGNRHGDKERTGNDTKEDARKTRHRQEGTGRGYRGGRPGEATPEPVDGEGFSEGPIQGQVFERGDGRNQERRLCERGEVLDETSEVAFASTTDDTTLADRVRRRLR